MKSIFSIWTSRYCSLKHNFVYITLAFPSVCVSTHIFTNCNLSAKLAKSELIMGLIRSNSIEIGQWFDHTCIDCFSCNVFLEAKNLLSSFRVGFYSSFLMTAIGCLIPNGLEVESQPIKACKKRSCLAFPKSWANLFMLYRRLTFPTLSKVKIRSYPFWSTKMLSST